MGNDHLSKTPDEEKIEALFQQFQPHPSSRFYEKIRHAPWRAQSHAERKSIRIQFQPTKKIVLGFTTIILILLFIGIASIPSIRAFASQVINTFIHAPTNQIEVQVTNSGAIELYDFANPDHYTLTEDEAEELAGFDVKVIATLPDDLKLVGARYDPNYSTVIILYQAIDYKLFLSQRLIGSGKDVFSIGSEAIVDIVKIGENQGEYVIGGWKSIATSQPSTSGDQININAIWDPTLPQYTLRWQEENIIFELRKIGAGELSQSELIRLADGLK